MVNNAVCEAVLEHKLVTPPRKHHHCKACNVYLLVAKTASYIALCPFPQQLHTFIAGGLQVLLSTAFHIIIVA